MTVQPLRSLTGVVVHAHRCSKTVKVRTMKRVWHTKLRKDYFIPQTFLADDYYEACVAGDIVRVVSGGPGLRTSRTKRHVVEEIVSPQRTGEERKPVGGVKGWLERRGKSGILEELEGQKKIPNEQDGDMVVLGEVVEGGRLEA